MKEENFYEILGLTKNATDSEIRKAFRSLILANHPDKVKEEIEKKVAEEALKHITEAYNVISRPEKKREYDEALARVERGGIAASAEESATDQARRLVIEAENKRIKSAFFDAMQLYDAAVKADPTNPYAQFGAGIVRLRNPKWRSEGEAMVAEAIKLKPFEIKFPKQLGRFYLDQGLASRARRYLIQAADINSEDEEVQLMFDKVATMQSGEGS